MEVESRARIAELERRLTQLRRHSFLAHETKPKLTSNADHRRREASSTLVSLRRHLGGMVSHACNCPSYSAPAPRCASNCAS